MRIALSTLCLGRKDQTRIKAWLEMLGHNVVSDKGTADYVLVHFPLTVDPESMAGHVSHTLPLLAKTSEQRPRLLFFGLPVNISWGSVKDTIDRTNILDATGSHLATLQDLVKYPKIKRLVSLNYY